MDRTVNAALAALAGVGTALLLASLPAAAQGLGDPTQPPPAAMLAPVAGAAPAAAPAGPELQSLLVSRNPGGRKVAVISGQTVRVGARVGDAVVTSIGEQEVVLRRGKQFQTLKLVSRAEPGTASAEKK